MPEPPSPPQLVSVIVPACNAARTLGACLAALRQQAASVTSGEMRSPAPITPAIAFASDPRVSTTCYLTRFLA